MATISPLKQLQAADTLGSISAILKIKPATLTFLLYKKDPLLRYTEFESPKRSGGKRQISAPSKDLKSLQRRVADLLQSCVNEISAETDRVDTVAHGFIAGRSIISNARPHVGKRYVFNLDLKDFFGTITFPRLYGYFMKDKNFLLPKKAATILAQIACHNGKLPQGSPCSPVMSNLIGHILDMHLVRLAAENGCTYTRYADDLTFSTNRPIFPEAIARRSDSETNGWVLGKQLAGLIKKCAFDVNHQKTRMQYRDSRQAVTGLTVNKKVNVSYEYRREVRAMVNSVLKSGGFHFNSTDIDGAGVKTAVKTAGSLQQLHGMLNFVDWVSEFNLKLRRKNSYNFHKPIFEKPWKSSRLFLRFMLYRIFWAAEKPVIICEGKTDNVYLTHAIRSLAPSFPTLAEVDASGHISLKARLFKYTERSTGRILQSVSGGSDGLCRLMRSYCAETKKFRVLGGLLPMIVLVDNDSGATGKGKVYDTVESLTEPTYKPTGHEQFIHVYRNLYVVATPLLGAKSSCIEDLFQKKDKVYMGKTFEPDCEKDTDKVFGKGTFAYKVVVPQANSIDFINFKELLEAVAAVMDHRSKALAAGAT